MEENSLKKLIPFEKMEHNSLKKLNNSRKELEERGVIDHHSAPKGLSTTSKTPPRKEASTTVLTIYVLRKVHG